MVSIHFYLNQTNPTNNTPNNLQNESSTRVQTLTRQCKIMFELVEPEHVTLDEPVCYKYGYSFVTRVLPGRIISL